MVAVVILLVTLLVVMDAVVIFPVTLLVVMDAVVIFDWLLVVIFDWLLVVIFDWLLVVIDAVVMLVELLVVTGLVVKVIFELVAVLISIVVPLPASASTRGPAKTTPPRKLARQRTKIQRRGRTEKDMASGGKTEQGERNKKNVDVRSSV